jgi:nicotinamide riboside transporter PnuC
MGFMHIAYLNAGTYFCRYVLRSTTSSWIPLVGGLAGLFALIIMPLRGVRNWWWLPPIVDLGCVFGTIHTIAWFAWLWFKREKLG